MPIVICPGFHPPELTQRFLMGIGRADAEDWVFPADRYPPYSKVHILAFVLHQLNELHQSTRESRSIEQIRQQIVQTPLLWIGFSAGVVGAIGAAHLWQILGGSVAALIAFDGWGVPLSGNFPIYRLSHDAFTDWSSVLLGGNADRFYADPPINHLDLWQSPQTVQGYGVYRMGDARSGEPLPAANTYIKTTAVDFLNALLSQHHLGRNT